MIYNENTGSQVDLTWYDYDSETFEMREGQISKFKDNYYGQYDGDMFLASTEFATNEEMKIYNADWDTPAEKGWEVSVKADENYNIYHAGTFARAFLIKNQGQNAETLDTYSFYSYEDGTKTLTVTKSNPIQWFGLSYFANYAIVETKSDENVYTIEKIEFN